MSRNPRELDHMEASALLLPRRYGGSEDIQSWEPWTRPPDPKAIDAEVTWQIERRDQRKRNPHMRTRAELDAIRIRCPYAHARFAVAYGAGDGTHDLLTSQAAKPAPEGHGVSAQLKDYAKEATDLIDQLGAFLERTSDLGLHYAHRAFSARADLNERNARVRRLNSALDQVEAAREALRILGATARETREQLTPSNNPGDVWRHAFVMRVGIAWRSLTGSDPSPSSAYFRRFVAAGFNSLGGPQTYEHEWKDHVATACKRIAERPEWDRWDREERDTLPPGTTVMAPGEYQDRQRQREERRTADICAFLDAATPEEAEAARMRLVGHWSWFPDTPQGERDLARIRAERGPKH